MLKLYHGVVGLKAHLQSSAFMHLLKVNHNGAGWTSLGTADGSAEVGAMTESEMPSLLARSPRTSPDALNAHTGAY